MCTSCLLVHTLACRRLHMQNVCVRQLLGAPPLAPGVPTDAHVGEHEEDLGSRQLGRKAREAHNICRCMARARACVSA